MSGCFDDGCACCWALLPDFSDVRYSIVSYTSGILFSLGWWLFVDAVAVGHISWVFIIPGIVSTLSLFVINAISTSQMDDSFSNGPISGWVARVWLMVGFILGFAGLISAGWIMFQCFIYNNSDKNHGYGISLFLSNLSLLLSSLLFKFGRMQEDYAYGSI
eukprot:Sdes_comp19795_c0_seq1m11885